MKKDNFVQNSVNEKVVEKDYSELMGKSFMSYAMSIIVARALPDIRDGLKPVQRRVLHTMDKMRVYHNGPYKKSARIVGDTMGKYHPHGDSSIYTALVNMAQTFKRNQNVIEGHGNYGSIEGDTEAAMRYTEAKLTKFAQDTFLNGNHSEVVTYVDNYDQTEVEPEVLPAKLPYALLNGAEGIAVGMTTAIPPHNLGELVEALSYVLKTENPTIKGVLTRMPGPDFPSGGIINNQNELQSIYEKGAGVVKVRGTYEFIPSFKDKETKKKVPDTIVLTSIPYTMIGEELPKFLKKLEDLINDGTLSEITKIENHSLGSDIKISLSLKNDADVEYIMNTIYQKTKFESSYGTSFLLIDQLKPVQFSIVQLLQRFSEELKSVYKRQYDYQLRKANKQKEIDEGLLKAISIINVIMEVAQGSKNTKDTKECLMTGNVSKIKFKSDITKMIAAKFDFTELQADAILKLTISRMVGLEVEAIEKDYNKLLKEIDFLEGVLHDEKLLIKEVTKDLKSIKKEYGTERKTVLDNIEIKKIVKEKEIVELVVLIDNFGYVHSITKAVYEKNKEAVLNDFKHVVLTDSSNKVLLFTNTGMVHSVKVEDIPIGALRLKGEPLDNLSNYDSSKELIVLVEATNKAEEKQLIVLTSDGFIKKMCLEEVNTSRKTVSYTNLSSEETFVSFVEVEKEEPLFIETAKGYFAKWDVSGLEVKKRNARGVTAVKFIEDGDYIKKAAFLGSLSEPKSDKIKLTTKAIKVAKLRK